MIGMEKAKQVKDLTGRRKRRSQCDRVRVAMRVRVQVSDDGDHLAGPHPIAFVKCPHRLFVALVRYVVVRDVHLREDFLGVVYEGMRE